MTTEQLLNLIPYALWSLAMLGVWGWLFVDDLRRFHADDRDNLEDLFPDLAMLLAGVVAVVALALIAAGVRDWRGFFVGCFFGTFLVGGLVKVMLRTRARRRRRAAVVSGAVVRTDPDAPYSDERY